MNTELRKSFSELKSKCKTKSQRLAFNELIKSFASIPEWAVFNLNILLDDPEEYGLTEEEINSFGKIREKIIKLLGTDKLAELNSEGEVPDWFYDKEDLLLEIFSDKDTYYYSNGKITKNSWGGKDTDGGYSLSELDGIPVVELLSPGSTFEGCLSSFVVRASDFRKFLTKVKKLN